jgi:hypothetical protein
LLNSHRELSKKNDALKSRIEKLKQKIYWTGFNIK